MLAGLVHIRVDSGENNQGTPVRETGHVSDLGHELHAGDISDTVHGENGLVFREHRGELDHLIAESDESTFGVNHPLFVQRERHHLMVTSGRLH